MLQLYFHLTKKSQTQYAEDLPNLSTGNMFVVYTGRILCKVGNADADIDTSIAFTTDRWQNF